MKQASFKQAGIRASRRAARLLAGTVASAVFVGAAGMVLFAATIAHYTPVRSIEKPADAIVVLTGGEHRVREAIHLFSQGKARRLLISGVNRATSRDDLKRKAGIDAVLFECCIDVGYDALDTIGNADEARAWAQTWGFKRLIVVTSNYHMPRSLTELSRAMPGVDLVPYPIVARNYRAETWWLYPGTIRIVVSEYIKFLPSIARLMAARLMPADAAPAKQPETTEPPAPVAPSLMRSLTTTATRATRY